MPETLQLANPTPLTTLTEDEILFRDSVRKFAEDKDVYKRQFQGKADPMC